MSDSPFHQHPFRAMGSQINVILHHAEPSVAAVRLLDVESFFRAAEQQLSRFRADSDLSRLNQAAGEWVAPGQLLWRVLCRAIELAEETGGLFDPTMLNAMVGSGYSSSYAESWRDGHAPAPALEGPRIGQWRSVELDRDRRAVRLPPHVRVDLGGIAKGMIAQQAVAWLSAWCSALVDAGGDVTAGDAPPGSDGWPVELEPPLGVEHADPPPTFLLRNGTLATSGSDYRWWQQGGSRRSHLMDPRTGAPAESDLLTVTVRASDAARAEAWSTAALVAGQQRALELLPAQGLDATLYRHDGTLVQVGSA